MNRDWGSLESIFSNDGSGGGEGERNRIPTPPVSKEPDPPPPPLLPKGDNVSKIKKWSSLDGIFSSDESDWGDDEKALPPTVASKQPIEPDLVDKSEINDLDPTPKPETSSNEVQSPESCEVDTEAEVASYKKATKRNDCDSGIDVNVDRVDESVPEPEISGCSVVIKVSESEDETDSDTEGSQQRENVDIDFPSNSYMKTHFDLMYYAFLIPFNGKGERKRTLHSAIFVAVIGFTILCGLAWQKTYVLKHVEVGNLHDYREAWYDSGGVIIGVAFVFFAIFNQLQMAAVLQKCSSNSEDGNKISKNIVLLALLSLLAPVAYSSWLDTFINGETVKSVLLLKAEYFSNDLLIWSRSNMNATRLQLAKTYGTNLSLTTMLFAYLGTASMFLRHLLENMARDVMLVAALVLNALTNHFRNVLEKAAADNPNITWQELSKYYVGFADLHNVSSILEKAFAHFFKIIHLDNLLWLSYKSLEILQGELQPFNIIPDLITLSKIVATYFYSVKSSRIGKDYRQRLLKTIDYDPKDTGLSLLLEQIKEFPVGIGSGRFKVNEAFIFSCFTIFLSWVFVIWNVTKENKA